MSRRGVEQKLRVARKAWKRFSSRFRLKFQELDVSMSVKTVTRRLTSAFRRSLRLLIPSKLPGRLRKYKSDSSYLYYRHEQKQCIQQYDDHHLQNENNFAAIHIDELFADQAAERSASTVGSRGKEAMEEGLAETETSIYTIDDAWNAVVASSPHLRPVDERAEEFIRKFRQDIILEKEKSLLEFQEMFGRSA